MESSVKYIFVTGGVVSSLGKGIVSASLGKLLQERGYRVTIQKFDPYINVDPGTLNPYEHGEVYVTEDGAETDLDLGYYERFLNVHTSQSNNVTTGRIYETVIKRERKGEYGGKTVQIIPHITDEIKRRVLLMGDTGKYDIVITEIGGTVGDIESLPYIEAVRQLHNQLDRRDTLIVHLTLVPYLKSAKELKTKPTQNSVKQLLEYGLQPDLLVCRMEHPLPQEMRSKIAMFCNVDKQSVIEAMDAGSIYEVPMLLKKEQMDRVVLEKLSLPLGEEPKLLRWTEFTRRLKNPLQRLEVALVGKYVELPDSYKSILESFVHAGAHHEVHLEVKMVHSEDLNTDNLERYLGKMHAIVVAPGFGERGIEGKLLAVQYARTQRIPFLGICLGMQVAVVEYGRNVLGMKKCHSEEFQKKAPELVISLMKEQKQVKNKGGTMRLGAQPCSLKPGTLAHRIYPATEIAERHRHRYEFTNDYREAYEQAGLVFSGINPEKNLVEIIEVPEHPFFLGVQFHPEYKSTPENPHPIFKTLVHAALDYHRNQLETAEEPAL